MVQRTTTAKREVYFAYRCCECGRISVNRDEVVGTGVSNGVFSASSEVSERRAVNNLEKRFPKYEEKINGKHKFPSRRIRCSVCNAPVQAVAPKVFYIIGAILLFIGFEFLMVGGSDGRPYVVAVSLCMLAVAAFLLFLPKIRLSAYNRKRTECMTGKHDMTYYPLIIPTDREAIDLQDPRIQALILEYAWKHPQNAAFAGLANRILKMYAGTYEGNDFRTEDMTPDHEKLNSEYRRAGSLLENARKKKNTEHFEKAAGIYDTLGTYRDSEFLAECCRREITGIGDKKKKSKKRVRIAVLIAAAAVITFICMTVYNRVIIPGKELKRAEELAENGDFEGARQIYEENGKTDEAREMTVRMGDAAFDAGDPARAMEYYRSAGDKEKIALAGTRLGDEALDAGDLDAAVAYYTDAGVPEKGIEAAVRYFETAAGKGDLEAAYGAYRKCGSAADKEIMLELILTKREAAGAAAITAAAGFGAEITDINGQLQYCGRLYDAGYDLDEVYPDGVIVDADLRQYSVMNKAEEASGFDPGILVFSVEEKQPGRTFYGSGLAGAVHVYEPSDTGSETYFNSHDRMKDDCLTVKLLPGMTWLIDEEDRAGSWEGCNTLLILETGYMGYLDEYQYSNTESTAAGQLKAQNFDSQQELYAYISKNISKYRNFSFYVNYDVYAAISLFPKDEPGKYTMLYADYYEYKDSAFKSISHYATADRSALLDVLHKLLKAE